MDTRQPSRWPLLVWLLASLAIHLAILSPAMLRAFEQSPGPRLLQARLAHDAPDPAQEPEPVQLGIEQSDASTLTWIGYEQYEQHLAQLGQVEQAAFDPAPAPPATTPMPPEHEQVPPAEPEQVAARETETEPQPALKPTETAPIDPAMLLSAMNEVFAIFNSDAPALDPQPQPAPDATNPSSQTPKLAQAEPEDDRPDEQSTRPAPAKPSEQESPPAAADTPPTRTADQADRESDASSIVEVSLKDVKLGKPLAAHGLELKPARPKFTSLQLVTLAPCCNPLTSIEFTRDGRPLIAKIIESSGHTVIDEAVETSLYKWRASGEPLARLKGEQTITVEIRIILVNH